MQLSLRIDDNNYLAIALQLQNAGNNQSADGPELVSATVVDSKLSQLSDHDILAITAQVVDYFSRDQRSSETPPDWYNDIWLPATRQDKGRL